MLVDINIVLSEFINYVGKQASDLVFKTVFVLLFWSVPRHNLMMWDLSTKHSDNQNCYF